MSRILLGVGRTGVPCVNVEMAAAVRKHKLSDQHRAVVAALAAARVKSIDTHIIDANETLLSLFTARIRDVYWLFKHHLGLNLASDLLDLTDSHGGFDAARSMLQG